MTDLFLREVSQQQITTTLSSFCHKKLHSSANLCLRNRVRSLYSIELSVQHAHCYANSRQMSLGTPPRTLESHTTVLVLQTKSFLSSCSFIRQSTSPRFFSSFVLLPVKAIRFLTLPEGILEGHSCQFSCSPPFF